MRKYIFYTTIVAALSTLILTGCESKAGTGNLAGGAIETSADSEENVNNNEQLSIQDVINMHNTNVSDDKIIDLIKKTNTRYNLTTRDIDTLQRAGLSNGVINYMLRS